MITEVLSFAASYSCFYLTRPWPGADPGPAVWMGLRGLRVAAFPRCLSCDQLDQQAFRDSLCISQSRCLRFGSSLLQIILRKLLADLWGRTALRSGERALLKRLRICKKNKTLCHQVTSGHNHLGVCGIMLQCIREQTEVSWYKRGFNIDLLGLRFS